jgi:hypothetical protein
MFQAIPLRARLSIHLDLIIQSKEALRSHFFDIMLNGNATKAWKLNIVQRPVKLYMPSCLNLKRSFPNGFSI